MPSRSTLIRPPSPDPSRSFPHFPLSHSHFSAAPAAVAGVSPPWCCRPSSLNPKFHFDSMELQCSGSHSQISANASAHQSKAWYVVSLLLSLGRPACPAELARHCVFFRLSPEFVQYLCWIPDSPLAFDDEGRVTLSSVAVVVFGRFVARSILGVNIGGWTVPRSAAGNAIRTYYRKRRRLEKLSVPFMKERSGLRLFEDVEDEDCVPGFESVPSYRFQAYDNVEALITSLVEVPTFDFEETAFDQKNLKIEECQHVKLDEDLHEVRRTERTDLDTFSVKPPSVGSQRADLTMLEGACVEETRIEINKSGKQLLLDSPCLRSAFEDHEDVQIELGHDVSESKRKCINSSDTIEMAASLRNDVCKEDMNGPENKLSPSVVKISESLLSAYERTVAQDLHKKPPARSSKHRHDVLMLKHKDHYKADKTNEVGKGNCSKVVDTIPPKLKGKQIVKRNVSVPDKSGSQKLNSSKDNVVSKALPTFESYVVEEEEGSGGYGTVYRAWRKSDGMRFAIKYPHPNANKHHVENERKMLERFGGRNFVVKYEGTCRSENAECFVLKHVEHDRPDVLRKDINVSELQWYGYCMFTALASLHKAGVIHRDVKPGNFLFSRKTCLGCIIDFNLAKDLHQKLANSGNSLNSYLKTSKAISPSKKRKALDTRDFDLAAVRLTRGFKSIEPKMLRNKALNASHRNSIASQGADGSGLTSTKDLSGRTPSGEKFREPLPCHGRKELINLAQEAMQNPKQEGAGISAYKRKRIAAPPVNTDRKLVYSTPMPVISSGVAIHGSGLLKDGGDGKVQKEGPCAGTKGFRAPEVLLRSTHQSPKVDVWSAGVTLLYLMVGKMPFTGEPEQNMKDIVKLRGSEELWELAKLHNRESSFPTDLYDVRFLQSMELREWCMATAKRPEFIKQIPRALFDLVDRCLTVNPRLRMTAEEALRHEFFAPCVDAMRSDRLLRQKRTRLDVEDNSHGDEVRVKKAMSMA